MCVLVNFQGIHISYLLLWYVCTYIHIHTYVYIQYGYVCESLFYVLFYCIWCCLSSSVHVRVSQEWTSHDICFIALMPMKWRERKPGLQAHTIHNTHYNNSYDGTGVYSEQWCGGGAVWQMVITATVSKVSNISINSTPVYYHSTIVLCKWTK